MYSHLFNQSFEAHNTVQDVKALIKVVFKSSLGITPEQVFSFGQAVTAKQANDDMQFLDQRHARTSTYRQMCFPDGRSVISDAIKQKLAIRGISYKNLEQIYRQFGKPGLFTIIALPESDLESDKKSRP